jgi:YesN/AraC family two-component response regulator
MKQHQEPHTILIVDDEPIIREMISNIIQWNRPHIHVKGTFANGQEALQYVRSGADIDLVITDIRMPIMDGITLIKTLKQEFPHMKFLLITAFAEFSYAQTALGVGALDYLVKPIRQQELLCALDCFTSGKCQATDIIQGNDYPSRLVSFLNKYIRENITTATIAEASECLGYSANHFSKLVQELCGYHFSELLHNAKMERATELFDAGVPMSQIICEIGYTSERRFRRAFSSYRQSIHQRTYS